MEIISLKLQDSLQLAFNWTRHTMAYAKTGARI